MLLDVIYSLFVAVTAGQGRKSLRYFRSLPDVIFVGVWVIRSVYVCERVAATGLRT